MELAVLQDGFSLKEARHLLQAGREKNATADLSDPSSP